MGSRDGSKPDSNLELKVASEGSTSNPVVEKRQHTEVLRRSPLVSPDTLDPRKDVDASKGSLTPSSNKSWYEGAWPQNFKANPVTQVAREITATSGIASAFGIFARTKAPSNPAAALKSPLLDFPHRGASSGKVTPRDTIITKTSIASNVSKLPEESEPHISKPKSKMVSRGLSSTRGMNEILVHESSHRKPSPKDGADYELTPEAATTSESKEILAEKRVRSSPGWLDILSKVVSSVSQDPNAAQSVLATHKIRSAISQEPPLGDPQEQRQSSGLSSPPLEIKNDMSSWSWLINRRKASGHPEKASPTTSTEIFDAGPIERQALLNSTNADKQPNRLASSMPPSFIQSSDHPVSTRWSYWLFQKSRNAELTAKGDTQTQPRIESPTQSLIRDEEFEDPSVTSHKTQKGEMLQSIEAADNAKPLDSSKAPIEEARNSESLTVSNKNKSVRSSNISSRQEHPDLVLPSFKHTFRALDKPSIFQQLGRLLRYNRQPNTKHVEPLQVPLRIKSALAIGVHGYFPTPFFRTVLGQPTGTSIRFANGAATAIRSWTQSCGYSCQIESVALEGEGKIAERVDLLWKTMLSWIEKVRKADLVMIACHSQGVPVALMLVAKLIALGAVKDSRVGVCALAGVNLGPFAEYKSRWISGSAAELFDFANPNSQVSKDYKKALSIALQFGVRITYIGSIDDQLVSLESSTFGTVSHPYIYRAVFVDGRVHAPDFLTHLVGFALKLRNLGVSDHGLVRELSLPLAGSLYRGEGHSRIYENDFVYNLAVEFTLSTAPVRTVPLEIREEGITYSQNPYILPFAMRGLLEENYVQMELRDETAELLKQFDEWKPSSKVLKDVKFRLEGVRSKL